MTFAEQIMHAAARMPHKNQGGGSQAVRLLTDAERLTARREHAQGYTVRSLATKYEVSLGQMRNCLE